MRPARVRRRGYILLEVLFGAALVGGPLIGLIDLLASSRTAAIAARREAVATQIVTPAPESAREYWGFDNFDKSGTTQTGVVTMGRNNYTRTTVITPKLDTMTIDGVTPLKMDYLLVHVFVSFEVDGVVHKVEGATRAYAEWGQNHVIY